MAREVEIQIVADRVTVRQGSETLVSAGLGEVVAQIVRRAHRAPSCGILPRDVRAWCERGDVTGVAVEIPPHARTVRWLEEGSKRDCGPGARYGRYFLSFPYVVLLLVFRAGALTGFQQLYYRRAPLGADEELLLPNLYNVAQGYGQRCWVCLASLGDMSGLPWPAKLHAIADHVFTSGWNRSSEVHEGNSYWGAMREIDPRVASPTAWQEASRQNARFALEVAWRPAGTTASKEVAAMMDRVLLPSALGTATELAGLVTGAQAPRRRTPS